MAIQIPLNAQLQNATQLQQQIQNAVNSVRLNLGGAGGSRALNSLSQPLGRLTGQADEFTKSLDAANARVLAFGASVGVLNVLSNAFKALVQSTIDVEKTLTDISVVFGKSSGEIKDFGKGIFTVAKQTGQSFQEVSKAALEFSRQGLNLEDTLSRTNDALILTRLTGLDTTKAVQGLTATINSFSKEALSSTEIVNKLASVDQKFAVSAADLTEALSRSASVAQNAGVNFDELIGIITSLQANTSRGGAVIGNSIKTIFTRIQRPEVLKDLQNLGVAVEDIKTGKLLSASQILKNLAGNVKALGEIQKSDIFEEVAGGFQINQLQALLGDLAGAQSTATKAQQVATGATNEAYLANEKLNKTISALINNSVEGLRELGATLGDLGIADSIKSALGVINGFIQDVQSLMEGEGLGAKLAQGLVKGIGSVLSGPGLALFGVVISKLIIDLGRFAVQGLKTFLGIGKAANEQRALQEAIVTTLSRNAALQSQINKFQGNAVAQAAVLAGIYNQQEASLRRQNAIAAGMTSVLFDQGMRAGPQGFNQTGRRRAAGGYLPSAEAADVSRGVGGASPSAQVVSIPNFAFGNGQRGTMIANTSEYIVPNYANGGSAIFNQDMVQSMGLPAGAQKIRAAGGYVPNFAEVGQKTKVLEIDAKKDLGGIGMITIGGSPSGTGKASYPFDIASSKAKVKDFPVLAGTNYAPDEPVRVINMLGSRALNALGDKGEEARQGSFSSLLFNALSPGIASVADRIFSQQLDSIKVGSVKLPTSGKLSPSAEGSIFQEIVSLAVDSFTKNATKSKAFQGEDNRSFDYEVSGPALPELGKLFFDGEPIYKADAKRTDGGDARFNMVKKIFNDARVFGKLLSTRDDIKTQIGKKEMTFNRGTAFKAEKLTAEQLIKRVEDAEAAELAEREGIKKASRGYIPNFANQALTDSINREKIQSGLPISAISVTQDSKLMNNRNPMGLAVINSRDEPNGKIPNFAAPQPLTAANFTRAAASDLSQSFNVLNAEIKKLAAEISKGTKTEIEAKQALDDFIKDLPNANPSKPGGKLEKSASLKNIQKVAGDQLSNSIPEKVAKGFGDAAGKIFLLQSAASFAAGAIGELDSSTGKLINKFSETAANITSIAIAGKELMNADMPGVLGNFAKKLGLAGLAAAGIFEGLKGGVAMWNEYTGANDHAVLSLTQFDEKLGDLSLTLDSLSPSTQKKLEMRGKEAIKDIDLPRALFQESLSENPEFLKQIGRVSAAGVSPEEIKKIVQNVADKNLDPDYFKTNINNTLDALYLDLSKAAEGKSDKVSPLVSLIKQSKEEDLTPDKVTEMIAKIGESGNQNVIDVVNANVEARQKQLKALKDEKKTTDEINLGQRISVDIAKLQIDNLIERKKLEIERAGTAEKNIKFQLATVKLSEQEKINLEAKLKAIEIEKKLRNEILDITKSGVDKALEGNINVTETNLKKVKQTLESVDLSKLNFDGVNFDQDFTDQKLINLQNDLMAAGDIKNAQYARNIIKSLAEQFKGRQANYKELININNAERDQLLKIDRANQALQSQLSIFQQIAKQAQSIADLNISSKNLEIAGKEARITKIDALMGGKGVSPQQKQAFEKEKINLQKEINGLKKGVEQEGFVARSAETSRQLAENQKELDDLEDRMAKRPRKANTKQNRDRVAYLTNEIDILTRKNYESYNSYLATNKAIDANTEALSIQEKQIGQVTGAYASLIEQLYNFKQSAGERIAGAEMGILSATDPNALASSTIQRQVEMEAQDPRKNLTNEEYYKLIQTEVPIRQKQFELSVETARVRRKELENEIELMREIAAISAATDEERLAKIKEIVDARNEEAQSFGTGFARGVGTLQDKTQKFRSEIGEQIPQLFSDNLAQGLNDAISGAKSLKEALTDAATSFFNAITQRNIQNLADMFTGGVGNFFTKKASGGMISGGSGIKDDVPAMLMGGEYVIKKSAVKKYGSNFLDSLNQGKLSGYAAGGAVQSGKGGFYAPGEYGQGAITGKKQLLEFATQSVTSGQFDQMGSYGMTGASINLEAESGRLTMAGRERSPIFERTQQAKEEAFQVYLESLKVDEQYKEQLKQIKEAEKARRKQLITSIAMAVGTSVIGAGVSSFSAGFNNAYAGAADQNFLSRLGTGFAGGIGKGGNTNTGGLGNLMSGNTSLAFKDLTKNVQRPVNYPAATYSSGMVRTGVSRAFGGMISGGSGVRDDVPAMLTGGEFVLNNRATQKLGMSNLQRLNSGDTSSQQNSTESSSDLTQALMSKLDELINATQKSGKDNIVVNVSGTDTKAERNDGAELANQKDLHKKIKAAVLEVINQEKRLGGSLNK